MDVACSSREQATNQTSPKPTIADIFRTYGMAYYYKYGKQMPTDQVKAMFSIMFCRSSEGGNVEYECSECGHHHLVPKACGNRNCPSCQGSKAKAWLQQQLDRLLPCSYFMITFTVPAEFRPFVRSHPKECYKALFDAAYATMKILAKDPKYIGSSRMGMTGVLHTWGRDVGYHPHVHFIVPGGALSEDGNSWLPSRTNFFVPVDAASRIFRAKYMAIMKRIGLMDKISKDLQSILWTKDWVVNSQAVGDGREALKYLAPYVFRIAIGNHRIVRVTPGNDGLGEVTYLVKPSKSKRYRRMKVPAEEFIRRYLQHVLPKRFQKVRHFGFMHSRAKTNWEWLAMLVSVTLRWVYVLTVTNQTPACKPSMKCPECGGVLKYAGLVSTTRRSSRRIDSS